MFNLAGVNRPKDTDEFMQGNCGFAGGAAGRAEACGQQLPRHALKLCTGEPHRALRRVGLRQVEARGEELFFDYGESTGAPVLVYRFPNVFGKWCRPNYNSAVATFCYNTAHDLPITVNDPATELELVYIDDVVNELIAALEGGEHRCDYAGLTPEPRADGRFCHVPVTHRVTLGRIAALLDEFKTQSETHLMPEIPEGSFEKEALFHVPQLSSAGKGGV